MDPLDTHRSRTSPRALLVLAAAVLTGASGLLPPGPAQAAGPCPSGQTALGGSLAGAPDGAPLNASVNVELTDASATRAYDVADGRVDTVGRPAGRRYSVVDEVNPDRTAATAAQHVDRTWGAPRSSAVLCFTTNPRIAQAFVEVYPRRPVDADGDGVAERRVTDRRAYGAAAHYWQPVRPGGVNTGIALRLPRVGPAHTGTVAGFVTYRGRPVPVAVPGCGTAGRPACVGITTVRAFPSGTRGPECGIEGFSASADTLFTTPVTGTRYAVRALAGGRCGAPTQAYSIRITCAVWCGTGPGGTRVRTVSPARRPAVRSGGVVRADVSFG